MIRALHPFPEVYILGAMRGGTTFLQQALGAHPMVEAPTIKELQFFSFHWHEGIGFYHHQLPRRWPRQLYTAAGRHRPITVEKGYECLLRLSRADPSNADFAGDTGIALQKMGEILFGVHDLPASRRAYDESLTVFRALLATQPGNAVLERDIWGSMGGLAQIPQSGVRWSDVVAQIEAAERDGTLAPADAQYLAVARRHAAQQSAGP